MAILEAMEVAEDMAELQDLEADQALRAASARWRRGEEQLYLAALSDADVYQRSLELVRRTVEHLRTLGSGSAALLQASARAADLVTDALAFELGGPVRVDPRLVADAALALRCREVIAERAAQRRLERLRAAQERGDTWVVLEISGDPEGDPLHPYRRLEAEARTGLAVLVTTAPEADFAASLHAVEAVRIDLRTGTLSEADDAGVAATTHRSAAAREEHASALRKQLTDR